MKRIHFLLVNLFILSLMVAVSYYRPLWVFSVHKPDSHNPNTIVVTPDKDAQQRHAEAILAEEIPAEISILLADYKYGRKTGIKICEVQQLILSSLSGYDFLYNGKGLIADKVCDFLASFQDTVWFIEQEISDLSFREKFKERGWITLDRLSQLMEDPEFAERASRPVKDAHNIRDYHGLLYIRPTSLARYPAFRTDYPGVLILDIKTFPYWIDKYKMSRLFLANPGLETVKPRWNLYPKKYTPTLADTIAKDLNCEVFVIKPRNAFKGNGVLIIDRAELELTLQTILGQTEKFTEDQDPALSYWRTDRSNSFLVEEFVASDPIYVDHLNNQPYDGTLRSIFVLVYHNETPEITILETHWKLPMKSLVEEGSWNEKHKSSGGKIPYYSKVDPATQAVVEEQLKGAMLLLYEEMLEPKKGAQP